MEHRTIGSLTVSAVGVGCNNFGRRIDEARTREVVDAALTAGVDFFDTADIYGDGASEELLGRALGDRRDDVVIATKFGMPWGDDTRRGGGSRRWAMTAVEDSLRRLGTDRIDLYQLHQPDPEVPIDETLGALSELVAAGKVREIGCSNFSGVRIDAAAATGNAARFVSVQNHYSVLTRGLEEDVTPAAERHDLAIIPYFPLEMGLLSGKYRGRDEPIPGTRLALQRDAATRALTPERLAAVERLTAFAEERGRTLLELAVSWLLARPRVASVIAGASDAAQVTANAAAGAWSLTSAEVAEVARLATL